MRADTWRARSHPGGFACVDPGTKGKVMRFPLTHFARAIGAARRRMLTYCILVAASIRASAAIAHGQPLDPVRTVRLTALAQEYEKWLADHRPPLYYELLQSKDPTWRD